MRLGILGAGQLGRMLGQAAAPLGVSCTFLDPAPRPCAGATGPVLQADYTDGAALAALSDGADAVTYEFENVPAVAVDAILEAVPVRPGRASLQTAQDRVAEKRFFESIGVPVAPWAPVDDLAGLLKGLEHTGLPAVLKTRRQGYDGKGQRWIRSAVEAGPALAALEHRPCVVEGAVRFQRELSVLVVRGLDGEVATWPLAENHHIDGILRWSIAPAPGLTAELQAQADAIGRRVAEALDHVGVLAVELFDTDGILLANELAPRVHNSGHWTIEASRTSQFENHVRAVLGLPLGATDQLSPCAMVNLIGSVPALRDLLAVPGARVHDYGKEPRAGRKVGHVTVLGSVADVDVAAAALRQLAG